MVPLKAQGYPQVVVPECIILRTKFRIVATVQQVALAGWYGSFMRGRESKSYQSIVYRKVAMPAALN